MLDTDMDMPAHERYAYLARLEDARERERLRMEVTLLKAELVAVRKTLRWYETQTVVSAALSAPEVSEGLSEGTEEWRGGVPYAEDAVWAEGAS